jgi:hypothetical protein
VIADPPADVPVGPAHAIAEAVSEQIAEVGQPVTTTLRALREPHPGWERMTGVRRRALHEALVARGVVVRGDIRTAALDASLTFEGAAQVTLRVRARKAAVKRVCKVLTVAGLILTPISFALDVWPHDAQPPPPSSADALKVAVGKVVVDGDPVVEGSALADSIEDGLSREGAAPGVQLLSSDEVDAPTGKTASERATEAAKIASRIGADILVFSRVASVAGRTVVHTEVYIDPHRLPGAEEIAGLHPLEDVVPGQAPIVGRAVARAVRAQVLADVDAAAHLAAGIDSVDVGRWGPASRAFRTAARIWKGRRGAGLAHLLVANSEGKRGRLDAAHREYLAALRDGGTAGRARLGLSEIALHRAAGECFDRAAAPALDDVARGFSKVSRSAARERAGSESLALRAHLGAARANLCAAQSGATDPHVASKEFREVIRIAGQHPGEFHSETAEAHAGLGLAMLTAGTGSTRPTDVREQYEMARELATDEARQAAFREMVGLIDQQAQAVQPSARRGGKRPDSYVPAAAVLRQIQYWQFGVDVIVSPRPPVVPEAHATAMAPLPAAPVALQGGPSDPQPAVRGLDGDANAEVKAPAPESGLEVASPQPQQNLQGAPPPAQEVQASSPDPQPELQVAAPQPQQDLQVGPPPAQPAAPAPSPEPELEVAAPQPQQDLQVGRAPAQPELQVAAPQPQQDLQVEQPSAEPGLEVAPPAPAPGPASDTAVQPAYQAPSAGTAPPVGPDAESPAPPHTQRLLDQLLRSAR